MDPYMVKLTHLISVNIFILHYLIKTILLLANSPKLGGYTKATKVPEMIVATLFLLTGGYLLYEAKTITTLQIVKLVMVFASIPIAVIGFKKGKKALAVLSLLLLIGAYGVAEISKKQGMKTSANAGKEVFQATCVKCHGEDGKAAIMGAKDLTVSTLDFNQKMLIVEEGKGTMVGYKGQLTPEQIKAVTEYVETLKK
jgi:mono/diheme cytochrome c family protein